MSPRPPDTPSGPPRATSAPPRPTSAPPSATSAAPHATAAPPHATSAPPPVPHAAGSAAQAARTEWPDRLRWLSRLRRIALLSVSLAALSGPLGLVPGIHSPTLFAAALLGLLADAWGLRAPPDQERAPRGQALFDTALLSLVLWGAGGADCPFLSFYIFPVLLAALLGQGTVWSAGAASLLGLAFQVAAVHWPPLRIAHWDPAAPFDEILSLSAVVLTVGMSAYFAVRFTEALRRQMRARHQLDTVLRVAIDHLGAGVEVVERGQVSWQNALAEQIFGARTGQPWRWPAAPEGTAEGVEAPLPAQPTRIEFSRQVSGEDAQDAAQSAQEAWGTPEEGAGSTRIYELHLFPVPDQRRVITLCLDRTRVVLDQRRLMLTERLASLGRTVQGVAHELNTPLATIQTLGRDTLDCVRSAALPEAVALDLSESAQMIVAEVQRCRRITHALLGRGENLEIQQVAWAPLGEVVQRARAVVFAQSDVALHVQIPPALRAVRCPLDPVVQILVNLLQNAQDAAADQPIELSVERVGARALLRVRDRGRGLSEAAREQLFEPFFTTKPPGRGTGLGLYTSYALAESIDATLQLENHPQGGAQALLSLKIEAEAP